MKKKIDPKIIIIIVLLIIFIVLTILYVRSNNNGNSNEITNSKSNWSNVNESDDESEDESEADSNETNSTNSKTSTTTKLSSSGEISSALTEQLELHATYYFSEIYVEENTTVKEGDNILLYTNGEYLTAPYDCVITSISVPDTDEQCTSRHYIEVEATNSLQMMMSVSETNIDGVSVGQSATIEVTALGKSYEGYVTNISSTANNGNFTITIEFENDGDIMIGMSATVSIEI